MACENHKPFLAATHPLPEELSYDGIIHRYNLVYLQPQQISPRTHNPIRYQLLDPAHNPYTSPVLKLEYSHSVLRLKTILPPEFQDNCLVYEGAAVNRLAHNIHPLPSGFSQRASLIVFLNGCYYFADLHGAVRSSSRLTLLRAQIKLC